MSTIINEGEICCNFCVKKRSEVLKLIAGPTSLICDECILIAWDICRVEVKGFLGRAKKMAIDQVQIQYSLEEQQIKYDFQVLEKNNN